MVSRALESAVQTDGIPAPAEPKAQSEGRVPGHQIPRLGRQGWLSLVGTPELGPEVDLAKRKGQTLQCPEKGTGERFQAQ